MSTSLGLSAGSGMIHCVLLTTDDNGRQSSINRVIDVDVTDGLTRAGRVNSGIDLMLGNAQDRGGRVGPIGVAYRTDEQAREIASRGTGAKRQIQLIAETEAVAHQLRSTGEISRFASVVVVDLGDTGMSMYTLDPRTGRTSGLQRSQAMSGTALDALLVQEYSNNGRLRGRRRSVLSSCRTAKEELSVSVSTSLVIGGSADLGTLTRSSFENIARPMAQAAATAVADYVAASRADAIVLIGGIANIPLVRALISEAVGAETVLPHGPESVAATGAARLAAATTKLAGLTFIGGRRSRDWLSAAPLAMFGALLAGALMTVYAVGSSLAGNPSTPTTQSVSPTVPSATTAAPPQTTTSPIRSQVTLTPTPTTTTGEVAVPPISRGKEDLGWATTELPPAAGPSDSPTRTLNPSLIPFPLPSITWPPGLVPPSMPPPESLAPEPPSTTEPNSSPDALPPPPAFAPPAPSDIPGSDDTQSDSVPTSPPAA
ncbi:UNVERIFIED_CONTAM: Hsp70 protein [Williamsia faeni]